MAVKVTSLHEWDIEKVVTEVWQPNIKAIIYFFSMSLEKQDIHKALVSAFPGAVCVGASMCGGWCSEGEGAVSNGASVMSLSSDEVDEVFVTFQDGVKGDPVLAANAALYDLKKKTRGHKIGRAHV